MRSQTWLRDVLFTAGLAVTFALLGPFGSYDAPLLQRLGDNLIYGFVSYPLLWPPMRLALRLNGKFRFPEILVVVAGLAFLTLPASLACWLVGRFLDPGGGPNDILAVYGLILTLVLPFGSAYLLIERRLLARASSPAAEAPRPKLLRRLPAHLGDDILALQSEDHYVRVHTPLGSSLLLMRLSDAIEELQGIEGERVHRSWWVARHAVRTIRPAGRRMILTLVNEVEAPVTRAAATRLRRAGWTRSRPPESPPEQTGPVPSAQRPRS